MIRRHPGLGLPALLAGLLAASSVEAAPVLRGSLFEAASARLPSMALAGPYGSPFQLAPGPAGAAGTVGVAGTAGLATPLTPEATRNAVFALPSIERTAVPLRSQIAPTESRIRRDEDDDPDDDRPVKPGTLTLNPVKIPTYDWRLQAKPVAPHLTPDVTYDLDSRTTIGLFNDTSKFDVKTGTALGSVLGSRSGLGSALDAKTGSGLLPSVRARDLGAGITLQYRFGD